MKKICILIFLTISINLFSWEIHQSTDYSLYPNVSVKYKYLFDDELYYLQFTYGSQNEIFVSFHKEEDRNIQGYYLIDFTQEGDIANSIRDSRTNEDSSTIHTVIWSLLLNLFNFYVTEYDLDYDEFDEKRIYDPYYGNNKMYYQFNQWIPLFNLYGIYSEEEQKYLVELVEVKIADLSSDNNFYQNPIDLVDDSFGYEIRELESNKTSINGSPITLDKNWKQINNSGNESYIIQNKTNQDAIIMSFLIDGKLSKSSVLKDISYSILADFVDPRSIQITDNGNSYSTYFDIIDRNNGYLTTSRFNYFSNENQYQLLILNSFKSIYKQNREYFETIMSNNK